MTVTNPHPECEIKGDLKIQEIDFSLILEKGPKISYSYWLDYGYTCSTEGLTAVLTSNDLSELSQYDGVSDESTKVEVSAETGSQSFSEYWS
jgi:hypothetical protein